MEVHHHPDLHHKKKHFKEYLLEFVMIFLAVALGFLAENLREHITNRSKEKEYISAIVHNLQDDTANLKHIIIADGAQVKGIDSFLQLKHLPMQVDSNRKNLYYFALRYFYNSASFKSNDATLQQLKSTGDYRLIEKDHAADSISAYDAGNVDVYTQGDYYAEYFKSIIATFDDMLDMTAYIDPLYVRNNKFNGTPLPAIMGDSAKMRTLFNKVFDFRIITSSYIDRDLQPQLENATRLITLLKKEYSVEE